MIVSTRSWTRKASWVYHQPLHPTTRVAYFYAEVAVNEDLDIGALPDFRQMALDMGWSDI